MKIAYITAGAAGMYCGSCMHDNTLVAALQARGQDALLIPTYTPITVDEPDVSQRRVFFGGINVFLQQKLALFRHTPWVIDRLLDAPRLLRWVARFAVRTRAEELGDLTVSMLQGEHGHQRKEVDKLVDWLARDVQPQLIILTNVILSGMVPRMKERLRTPILGTLQGDDIFLEALPASCKGQALALIQEHCRQVDGFLATCAAYADFMAGYLAIPREKIHIVYPGLNLAGHLASQEQRPLAAGNGPPFTIGYFARICPEKGLHILIEAFRLLRQMPGAPPARLRVSGWLGAQHRPWFDSLVGQLRSWGLADAFEHLPSPDHAGKVRFLQSLDVLSVPTVYREPKGLYVLEAWANGVPVVQPRHGSFPELIAATGGGLLVNPEDPLDLARALRRLIDEPARRQEMGQQGLQAVRERFTADIMAARALEVFQKYLRPV